MAQALGNLDPKLKEAYERVMNAPSNPLPDKPTVVVAAKEEPKEEKDEAATVHFGNTIPEAKKGGASPFLIILLIIILLLGYTLFWVKFLKVTIPFVNLPF